MADAPVTLDEIKEYIFKQLPRVLEQDPRFVTFIEGIVAEKFPRRDEFARLLAEVQQHRQETQQRFDQVDQRFEQVDQRFEQVEQKLDTLDQRMDRLETNLNQLWHEVSNLRSDHNDLRSEVRNGFLAVHKSIDRLGQRWGIRNEILFRQTMRTVLERHFGAKVEERQLRGEQIDCIIFNGEHILVEISASVGPDIRQKLERKRQLYIDETGVTPARFILAAGSIYSRRAEALRAAGFDVIEPEEEEAE
jgi:hypothetical protein